mgnify:CR=1 FL=1
MVQYGNNVDNEQSSERQGNNIEILLDLIADALIQSPFVNISDVEGAQKTIRNGIIQVARDNSEKLLLFESDVKANEEDMTSMDLTGTGQLTSLAAIVDSLSEGGYNITQIDINSLAGGNTDGIYSFVYLYCSQATVDVNITSLIQGEGNPFNVSQFMNLMQSGSVVSPDQANEFLDTTIYELLPTGKTRQQRIDELFAEVETLKGLKPNFPDNTDLDTGDIDAEPDYEENHDISYAQENEDGIEEEEAFITRLNIDANVGNEEKTIQSLRDRLNTYLLDIDQVIEAEIDDSRPEYKEKSDGYLKIRNLNQGIIIRKQEGDDIGIEREITIEEASHPHDGMTGPSYLQDGFTISIWARFLDKTSKGTLFNYGNPLRSKDPRGFVLETYVLNKDDITTVSGDTWGQIATAAGHIGTNPTQLFSNSDSERFIRLVVYDHLPDYQGGIRKLYDSSKGIPGIAKDANVVPEFGYGSTILTPYEEGYDKGLLTHTRVPIDFNEWYFIVANFNPMIDDATGNSTGFESNPDYWNGNIVPNSNPTEYIHYSGFGNKCKVEIISKSDLLRARGYKV